MDRYSFFKVGCLAFVVASAVPGWAQKVSEPVLVWHEVGEQWQVEGRGWMDEERGQYFHRLPASAQGVVPDPVWALSQNSSGLMVRFKTDAASIWVDYELTSERLALVHMPATGASGVDLYARDEEDGGRWKWVNVSRPAGTKVKAELIRGLRPGLREYALYLPLYNGVASLQVGVPEGAVFEALKPREALPILFYGTSITHGASASRPGMVHTAILGRWLDWPVINLGFSGNGKMDASVGTFLERQKMAVLVIDCAPNMNAELLAARTVPLVKQVRAAQPELPIVLVEDRRWTNSWVTPEKEAYHDANHAALRAAFEALTAEGVEGLHYIGGDELYGTDAEGAVDASHATDLGFMRQAAIFEPVLREILGADKR